MKTIELWHGGRNLETDYREFKSSSKGRWEHGPGLYLTTHYERARDYAKGGGKTYLVTIEEGNDIEKTFLDISDVNLFVSKYLIKSKQKDILNDLYDHMKRVNTSPKIKANILLNLIINYDAITSSKTHYLNSFLVEQGIDYSIVNRYGGRDENIMVIFNLNKIKKVKSRAAKDIPVSEFEKDFIFQEVKNQNKI